MLCKRCNITFPEDCFTEVCCEGDITSGDSTGFSLEPVEIKVCGICALDIVRKLTGENTYEFTAPLASIAYRKACEWRDKVNG